LADRQVQQIERLTESEIPKSPNLRTWCVVFSAMAMAVLLGLYVFRSGAMHAAQLLEQGVRQSEVARRLGVHWQSVNRWVRQIEQERSTGLKQADPEDPGPRLLNGSQLKKLERPLKRGPEAAGYASELSSASRVHTLIEKRRSMGYDEAAHVWRT